MWHTHTCTHARIQGEAQEKEKRAREGGGGGGGKKIEINARVFVFSRRAPTMGHERKKEGGGGRERRLTHRGASSRRTRREGGMMGEQTDGPITRRLTSAGAYDKQSLGLGLASLDPNRSLLTLPPLPPRNSARKREEAGNSRSQVPTPQSRREKTTILRFARLDPSGKFTVQGVARVGSTRVARVFFGSPFVAPLTLSLPSLTPEGCCIILVPQRLGVPFPSRRPTGREPLGAPPPLQLTALPWTSQADPSWSNARTIHNANLESHKYDLSLAPPTGELSGLAVIRNLTFFFLTETLTFREKLLALPWMSTRVARVFGSPFVAPLTLSPLSLTPDGCCTNGSASLSPENLSALRRLQLAALPWTSESPTTLPWTLARTLSAALNDDLTLSAALNVETLGATLDIALPWTSRRMLHPKFILF
ncbi:hypothetical protein EDB85DRAFT_1890410 [Lactarius pseudohatsudake]|nr:hypothetical protein EDB85DRAFT_1890410 [Lactarius pseudohatsudake]